MSDLVPLTPPNGVPHTPPSGVPPLPPERLRDAYLVLARIRQGDESGVIPWEQVAVELGL